MVCCPLVTVMSDSLPPHGLQPAMLLCPWDFHKNTGEVRGLYSPWGRKESDTTEQLSKKKKSVHQIFGEHAWRTRPTSSSLSLVYES